jgi:sterol desaturase/sphingolipid hydroxylase (fatty acid hydroxylase superfamily)
MEAFVDFFENVPTVFRAGMLVGGIFLFWVIEGVFPLFQFEYKKLRHAGLNLTLNAIFLVIGLAFASLLVWSSTYVNEHGFGLLHLIALPLWAQAILGVLLLDFFGAYLSHWIDHKIPSLWRFH